MSSTAFLNIEHLCKSFAHRTVVSDFCVAVNQGELVSLLGPSGCGKTTTLRLIGGFLAPDSGEIFLDGIAIQNLLPENRPVCTVFQSYALFPHMTALENVMYGLRCSGMGFQTSRHKGLEMLSTVGLADQANQNVTHLSGGQQQRVALARVLVLNPKVLLLDEPFSNMDANLRVQMRDEVRSLQSRFNLTTIFVTHDREEAMGLSDRIAVMQDGCIVQFGTPREIYTSPVNLYVAECVGHVNKVHIGDRVLAIRPEHVQINKDRGEHNGIVVSVSYLGFITRYLIDYQGDQISVDVISGQSPDLRQGEPVSLSFGSSFPVV